MADDKEAEDTLRALMAAVIGQTCAAWALVRDDGVSPREAVRMVGVPEEQAVACVEAIKQRLGREVGPPPTMGIDAIRFRALAALDQSGN